MEQQYGHTMKQSNVSTTTSQRAVFGASDEIRSGDDQDRRRGPGWRGPLPMIVALLAGLVLAIAHDLFYQFLNGRPLNQSLSQTWVTRIGTGVAFLAKTAFVIAVASAYVQRQWMNLRHDSYKMREVDDLTGVLYDIMAFFNVRLWLKMPLLFCIALLAWSLPLIAIVTPSALVVESRPFNTSDTVHVPQLSFNGSTYYKTAPTDGDLVYEGAMSRLLKVTYGAATSSEILSIPHAHPNMTYNLEFTAPAIQCKTANDTIQNNVYSALIGHVGSFGSFNFIGCVPDQDDGVLEGNGTMVDTTYGYIDRSSEDTCRLFLINEFNYEPTWNKTNYWKTTECQLYNATYDTDFTFTSSSQQITVRSIDYMHPVPYLGGPNSTLRGATVAEAQQMAYQAVMEGFGRMFAGYIAGKNGLDGSAGNSQLLLTSVNWTAPLATMQRELEGLFQNMTISLMSSSDLTYNSTQRAAIPVTVTTYYPVYVYQHFELYLTYGLALGFSSLCVVAGLLAMHTNGASYSNKFSTFIRSTGTTNLSRRMDLNTEASANPLPKPIARARLSVRFHKPRAEYEMLST